MQTLYRCLGVGACAASLSAAMSCGSDVGSTAQPSATMSDGTLAPDAPEVNAAPPSTPSTPSAAVAPGASTPAVVEGSSEGGAASPLPIVPAPSTPNGAAPTDETPAPALEPAASPQVGPEPELAVRALCTGTDPITCHLGGAPGNYDVSVVLGGAVAATTVVLAETRRTLLGPITTAAGETRRFSFSVNVRAPEGEPIQAVPAGSPGLDLYFSGSAGALPALESLGYAAASRPLVVYLAGDSTVCDQSSLDYGGWGQQLPQYFNSPVVVANYADSGESSGSFLNARPLFGAVESRLQAGDWVLIQFGHNDKTVTAAEFHDNLSALVTRVQDRGARPVLLTPVARAQFDGAQVAPQHINGTGANLPQLVAQVANERGVPLLDLTARTSEWLAQVGPSGWQAFHALGTDVTHTNDAGAAVEAGLVRELLEEHGLTGLTAHLR